MWADLKQNRLEIGQTCEQVNERLTHEAVQSVVQALYMQKQHCTTETLEHSIFAIMATVTIRHGHWQSKRNAESPTQGSLLTQEKPWSIQTGVMPGQSQWMKKWTGLPSLEY